MKAIINHLSFEFKSVLRDKSLLLMNYLFPLVFYLMMALIMPGIYPAFNKGLIPGMIVFAIMVSTLLGMPNPIVQSKEKGIYRSYKIYGVPLKSVLLMPVITTMIHITLVSVIIVISGSIFFKAEMPTNIISFIFVYSIVLFTFTGLGLLLGVCSPNGRITVLLAQLVFLPSMMLGGMVMPTNILPESIRKIAAILPATYGMDVFKSMAFNQKALFNVSGSVTVLVLSGLIAYILAAYLFTWDINTKNVLKNLMGFIAFLPFIIGIFIL
jgi:ABC-2 type transport system permease protein